MQDCWMQIHCQCARLRKASRVKMVRFQGLKILTRRKAVKKMFLSFTDKIKANLKQKLASRIRNKESIVRFLRVDSLSLNSILLKLLKLLEPSTT